LAEEGIEIDSSIFPASRGHGGIKDFALDHPFCISACGNIIREFPINVFRIANLKIPFSGGGYFRFFPIQMILYFMDKSDYVMTYFHPQDFDLSQPVLDDLPLLRRIKSYWGIKYSLNKFETFIKHFEFADISTTEKASNWYKVPIISL
jgi:hypothetical protein